MPRSKWRETLLALTVVLSTYSSGASPPTTSATVQEAAYFQTRDAFIHQFKNGSGEESDNRKALTELGRLMRSIVGPIHIEGFESQGEISLQTVLPEMGFGQIDGLLFRADGQQLFVTTQSVLRNYLSGTTKLPSDRNALSQTDDFYRLAFSADARTSIYAQIPLHGQKRGVLTRAYLGLRSQDTGPFLPGRLWVFASGPDRIMAVDASVQHQVMDIPLCRHQVPTYADAKATQDYIRCFSSEVLKQSGFPEIQRLAQDIANRLAKGFSQ